MNENPHQIVLNQVLTFSESSWDDVTSKDPKVQDPQVSENIRLHWASAEDHFRKFAESLKTIELLTNNTPMDHRVMYELQNKISNVREACKKIDDLDIQPLNDYLEKHSD
jgi:hypothetical protein